MQLLYGNGGVDELPTVEESSIVEAAVESAAYTLVGDALAANAVLTNVPDTSLVLAGDKVYGPGWNAAATVLSKTLTSVTMTGPADNTQVGGEYAGLRDGSLQGSIVVLVKELPGVETKNLVFADLTPCDFTGYVESGAIEWGTPLVDADGNAFITGDKKQFRATGSAVANDVVGAALCDAAKTTVFQFDVFKNADGVPTPVHVEGAGTGLDYVPLVSVK